MAELSHRELIEQLMASRPQFAEAIACLANLEAGIPGHLDSPRHRWDHELITELIEPGASVLDIGCGDGELLSKLIAEKGVRGQGLEKIAELAVCAVERGVPVVQQDVDNGLAGFGDGLFDYVVLEETLQTVSRPATVLSEILRVGRVCIVSFPNFGHWWARTQLLVEGRMPTTPRLPFTWYGTPNIHVLTVRDFEGWCKSHDIQIRAGYAYADGAYHSIIPADNVLAEEALFVIGR